MNILERSWTSDRSILLSRVMVYIFTAVSLKKQENIW